MEQPTGVLLDVDGTLVDSNDAHDHAWVKALAGAGVTVEFATVRRLIGKGGDKLLPEVSGIDAESDEGKAIIKRRGEIFQKEYLPTLKPFPGAKELLARMKKAGLELAVASSAKKDELKGLLDDHGADARLVQAADAHGLFDEVAHELEIAFHGDVADPHVGNVAHFGDQGVDQRVDPKGAAQSLACRNEDANGR